MRIETSTEPGTPNRPNEDFAAIAIPACGAGNSAGSLVLLDGVTPPPANAGCVHSVPWYVAALGGAMIELSVSRPELSLADCLATAIDRTAGSHRSTCDLSHRLTPQATVVTVRWNAEIVDHLVLSDSVLLLEDTAGCVRPVLDDRLGHLRAAGPVTDDQRNVEGGFFTAAADPAVAARAVTGSTPRADVRALAALTDGATRLVEGFHEDDWAGTFALLRKQGPEELIRRVRAAENADADRVRFPRWKTHDDATVVLAEL